MVWYSNTVIDRFYHAKYSSFNRFECLTKCIENVPSLSLLNVNHWVGDSPEIPIQMLTAYLLCTASKLGTLEFSRKKWRRDALWCAGFWRIFGADICFRERERENARFSAQLSGLSGTQSLIYTRWVREGKGHSSYKLMFGQVKDQNNVKDRMFKFHQVPIGGFRLNSTKPVVLWFWCIVCIVACWKSPNRRDGSWRCSERVHGSGMHVHVQRGQCGPEPWQRRDFGSLQRESDTIL